MKKCMIYHTGIRNSAVGVIKDNKVYIQGENNTLYFPKEMFMAIEECECGFIQFEVDGKWGFADIYTGKIVIEPVWDYAGPFYGGYAHVALDVNIKINDGYYIVIEGGNHGYINIKGKVIIPIEYDDACEISYRLNKYFKVSKNGKWGLINNQNKTIIPFNWNRLEISYERDFIFCVLKVADMLTSESESMFTSMFKWGVYDKEFNLIVEPELDESPYIPMIKSNPRSRNFSYYKKYYILRKDKKYGILCDDGRLIANIELSKKQAKNMINSICERKYAGEIYI